MWYFREFENDVLLFCCEHFRTEGLNNMLKILKSAIMLNPRLLHQCPNGCQGVDLRDTVANKCTCRFNILWQHESGSDSHGHQELIRGKEARHVPFIQAKVFKDFPCAEVVLLGIAAHDGSARNGLVGSYQAVLKHLFGGTGRAGSSTDICILIEDVLLQGELTKQTNVCLLEPSVSIFQFDRWRGKCHANTCDIRI